MSMVRISLAAILVFNSLAPARDTREVCEKAVAFVEQTRNKVYRQTVTPRWFDDNNRFWYRNELPEDRGEFILVEVERGLRGPAFDHSRLAQALAQASGKEVLADRLPFEVIAFQDKKVKFAAFDKGWTCDLETYAIESMPVDELNLPTLRPGRGFRRAAESQEETQITFKNTRKEPVDIYWVQGRNRTHYATLEPGQTHAQHTFVGHAWLVTDPEGKTLAIYTADSGRNMAVIDGEMEPQEEPRRRGRGDDRGEGLSPDGKSRALVRDNNVYLRDMESGEEFALTQDGTAEESYGRPLLWSPDSSRLMVLKTRKGQERTIWFVESSPTDQLQPKLQTRSYNKPGDVIDTSKPCLFDIPNRRQIPVSDELFANPWSTGDYRWAPDSSRFTFSYNQRGHQVLRILAVSAADGRVTPIVDEQSKTFIDYAGKSFTQWIADANEIIWMSERDGWNHLYRYDALSGQVKNQITKGPWVVRGIERVDEAARQIWFYAGGIRPGQDPYYKHFCRVNFDGTGLTILTEGDGDHSIDFSPDRRFLIDRWSRVDLPPVTELRSADDGRLICELERADWTELLATGWRAPERFVAKGRDGRTDIYGIIIRPSTFDPNQSYPVIEQIYAGPQGAFVPKSFGVFATQQELAELGFIVVQIDGMGTSNRSKAFHDVCWKNLVDAGFADRILWMQAAAQRYPYMDLSRVGIYGGSAGGQNALGAVLTHPEFYKAAAADCGCHDNRMDKIWWNELWMGWPIGPHYEEQSNVTLAPNLEGDLLLTVGELDDNVDPASTMQVVNALIKADKDFELIVFPGRGHGAGGSPYGKRQRMDFFIRSLRPGE